jgi:hypothetical protein
MTGSVVRRVFLRLTAAAVGFFAAGAAFADPEFLSPGRGEALSPGSVVEVRWGSLCGSEGARAFHEAELILSLDGGLTFPVRVSHELSTCETRTLWRVPVLPTGNARLAVRVGSEWSRASEKIVAVSAEFRILPDLDGRVQQLLRRAAEWWTPEPAVLTAEDLLSTTIAPDGARLVEPQAEDSLEDPSPPAGPAARHAVPRLASERSIPSSALRAHRRSFPGAATPLRL